MASKLEELLKFTDFLHKFRTIERVVFVQGLDRRENDVEHSYTLAFLAWYINSSYELSLDSDKLLKYALAHDIVETYAGDTYFYHADKTIFDKKKDLEHEAAIRIQNEFPEFPELHKLIEQYEMRQDPESKFVYALDKIEPVLSIYLDGGRTWKDKEISLEMLKTMKTPKVEIDSTISNIFQDLLKKLAQEHDSLFENKA